MIYRVRWSLESMGPWHLRFQLNNEGFFNSTFCIISERGFATGVIVICIDVGMNPAAAKVAMRGSSLLPKDRVEEKLESLLEEQNCY